MGIELRPAVPRDWPAITAIYNHYVMVSAITFDLRIQTPAQRRPWFEGFADHGPHRLLVASRGDQVLGYVASLPFKAKLAYHTSVETSVYCRPDAVGLGLGLRLYQALFQELSDADLHRAYAGITRPNPGSVAVHRRVGFEAVARYREVGRKFGRYWDVEWFEKAL